VHPHSTTSDIPIWKCAWCGIRKGKLTETEIKTLESYEKANALWPGIDVTLRSKRVAELIKQHDQYLRKCGWYDVITATLDENWMDDAVDGYLCPGNTD
jgi:hypothetical protein